MIVVVVMAVMVVVVARQRNLSNIWFNAVCV
jgi:hypothetical protein